MRDEIRSVVASFRDATNKHYLATEAGDYKTANPYAQGMTDFISVLVIALALSFTLNFSPKSIGAIFNFYNALGLVIARFALELFLALKAPKLFENMGS